MNIGFNNEQEQSGGVIRQQVLVDLSHQRRDNVNIGTAIEIYARPKNKLKNFFGLSKSIHRKLSVSLVNFAADPDLVLSDEMISVLIDSEPEMMRRGNSVPIEINGETTRFQLIFHPSSVLDCKRVQGRGSNTFDISFSLSLRDEKNNEICSQKVELGIDLVPVDFRPEVEMSVIPPLQFMRTIGVKKIGQIVVRDTHTLERIPAVGLKADFTATREGNPVDADAVWLELPSNIEGLSLTGDKTPGFEMKKLDTRADGHAGTDTFAVDIMCDMNRIGNPCDAPDGKADIDIRLNLRYHALTNPGAVEQLMVPDAKFTVLKNVSQPELRGTLTERDSKQHVIDFEGNASPRIKLGEISFLPSWDLFSTTTLSLRNTAENGPVGSGIVIRNIKLTEPSIPPSGKFEPSNRRASLATLVTLKAPSEIRLPNGDGKVESIGIRFDGREARELYLDLGQGKRNYQVPLAMRLGFDYLIDEEGIESVDPEIWNDPAKSKHFDLDIVIPVYQLPNPNWLSVDFGTSAIVGMFSSGVIDLHGRKNQLQNVRDDSDDKYERGTKFLSSNVILRKVADVIKESDPESQLMGNGEKTASFEHLAVCLSPTSRLEEANIRTLLPCLKMMVGYDYLPDIDNYSDFKYWCSPCEGEPLQRVGLVLEDSDVETARLYSPLAKVDEVFRQVYQQLFRYYINDTLSGEANKVNKLVLTVPNTYSPYHLQRIRNIIQNNLAGFHIRDIRFVSESDAVACYYQTRWDEINKELNRKNIDELRFDETVLVFDMGAGTLDLTLFTRGRNPKTNAVNVRVLGKLGISKAGNYLDALLAELLAREIPALKRYADPDSIIDGDALKGAISLKALIKNSIKPALSKGGKIEIKRDISSGIRENTTLDLDKVFLNTKEFKDFVDECTSQLLANFFDFFKVEDDIRVDTILMSGRSAKLKPVKDALDKIFSKYAAPDAQIIEVKDLGSANDAEDKTKTIVAEGATYYVDLVGQSDTVTFETDNLSARYGVVYTGHDGQMLYKELLDPRRAKPISTERREGIVVKAFDSDEMIVDLSHCVGADQRLTLIQTYHKDPVKALNEGLTEYITEVASFDPRTFSDKSKTRLRLEVTRDNMMKFYINGYETPDLSATKIDVTSKTSRRSFWPVIKKK